MLWVALALGSGPCPTSSGGAVDLHLVSVTPGDDLFSSMGHTALLFTSPGNPGLILNWGAYDGKRANVQTFLRGELPYFLNRQPFDNLVQRTRDEGRTMVIQRLDVPTREVLALLKELEIRSRPETRAYDYHWRDANCATMARDALDEVLGGALRAATDRPVDTDARFEATRHLHRWPVLSLAWRHVVNSSLDRPLTAWERTMLPEHLMREVAALQTPAGPLVFDTCTMVEGPHGWAPAAPPATWPLVLPGLLGGAAAIGAGATGRSRVAGALAVLYGAVLAVLGTASFALWSIGSIDGVGPTEGWLVAGPQTWGLVGAGAAALRGRLGAKALWTVRIVALLGIVAAVVGPFTPQANGDVVAALLPGLVACALGLELAGRRSSSAS